MENIRVTDEAFRDMRGTSIQYYPQKGIMTALDFELTDVVTVFAMLLIATVLVRAERDNGLLALVRSTPAGRLNTAGIGRKPRSCSGLPVWRQPSVLRRALWSGAIEPLHSKCAAADAQHMETDGRPISVLFFSHEMAGGIHLRYMGNAGDAVCQKAFHGRIGGFGSYCIQPVHPICYPCHQQIECDQIRQSHKFTAHQ